MRTKLTAYSRRDFYIANITGFVIVVGLIIWLFTMAVDDQGFHFTSVYFWLALLLLIIIPFAFISFFSAMKSVSVTDKGLVVAYSFRNHKSVINFSDVKEMKSGHQSKKGKQGSHLRENFQLVLKDGRVFEFSRSQLQNFDKLKGQVAKAVS